MSTIDSGDRDRPAASASAPAPGPDRPGSGPAGQAAGDRLCREALAGVPEKSPSRLRVVFAGTHPAQFNGYSRVTYDLCSRLAADRETELFVFGFQCPASGSPSQAAQRKLPPGVHLYDAAGCEEPRERGFGTGQMETYLRLVRPDVLVVYNDPIIVNKFASALFGMPEDQRAGIKFVPYLDQIYQHLRPGFVSMLNQKASAVICFTPYWEQVFAEQGGKVPTAHLRHGFDPARHFPVPRDLARRYFGLNPDDFVFLNLNRNQPRKRWDVCLKAWAEFVQAYPRDASRKGTPKLLIATSLTGAWNLMEVYERELAKRGISPEEGRRHIIMLTAPQAMTDSQVNILYSAADVGVNTADGEGFGLCTFEHAGVGAPQVASRVGGIRDFLTDDNSILCDEVYRYYVDTSRDHVGGEAQLVDPFDVYTAMEAYYTSPEAVDKHSRAARDSIAGDPRYSWDRLAERLSDILHEVHGPLEPVPGAPPAPDADPRGMPAIQEEEPGSEGAARVDPKDDDGCLSGEAALADRLVSEEKAAPGGRPERADDESASPQPDEVSLLRSEIHELKRLLIASMEAGPAKAALP